MNTFYEKLNSWRESFHQRRDYCCTGSREPFYDIALPYLPDSPKAIVVDIGAGEGEFAEHLNLYAKYTNLFLLDANIQTIQNLKKKVAKAILYRAPERLPFEDSTVVFIHCSHMVEHLHHAELYSFLKETNRVLSKGGILVISAPLLWKEFYCDLSHTKPYNPSVFTRYLCAPSGQYTAESISEGYTVERLVYRYTTVDFGEWGASNLAVDFIIQVLKRMLRRIGINRYVQNGFTLVLRKI